MARSSVNIFDVPGSSTFKLPKPNIQSKNLIKTLAPDRRYGDTQPFYSQQVVRNAANKNSGRAVPAIGQKLSAALGKKSGNRYFPDNIGSDPVLLSGLEKLAKFYTYDSELSNKLAFAPLFMAARAALAARGLSAARAGLGATRGLFASRAGLGATRVVPDARAGLGAAGTALSRAKSYLPTWKGFGEGAANFGRGSLYGYGADTLAGMLDIDTHGAGALLGGIGGLRGRAVRTGLSRFLGGSKPVRSVGRTLNTLAGVGFLGTLQEGRGDGTLNMAQPFKSKALAKEEMARSMGFASAAEMQGIIKPLITATRQELVNAGGPSQPIAYSSPARLNMHSGVPDVVGDVSSTMRRF